LVEIWEESGEERMILFPHMLVGAAIGSKVKNFGAIFVIATLLHFLFDRFPHMEYFPKVKIKNISMRNFSLLIFFALIDLAAGFLMIWWFLKDSLYSHYVLTGIFISILPDGLVFLYLFTRRIFNWDIRVLRNFYLFHDYIHISKDNNAPVSGLIIEGLIIVLSTIVIFSVT
jgi:hypothetical protein